MDLERKAFVVRGVVQGVGFRPFVHALATRYGLSGWVRNQGAEVAIEVEGDGPQIRRFVRSLIDQAPPLARIDDLRQTPVELAGDRGFLIRDSASGAGPTLGLTPDTGICDACMGELLSPRDRRHQHPFIACSDCGPRLTIALGAPYDRSRTTMAAYIMCDDCRREYDSPRDRRFHAQPIACHRCGPRLRLLQKPAWTDHDDPLQVAVETLEAGLIVAVKGLGGYHLACDATSAAAVSRLRHGKLRAAKPFAVMVENLERAAALAQLDAAVREALSGPERPVVVVRRRGPSDPGAGAPELAEQVAPGVDTVGLMLPYSGLHALLARALSPRPLVMTSGNISGGPIAVDDRLAAARLGDVAACILSHDRPISVACEDSVVRVAHGRRIPLRRSRGLSPLPLELPCELEVQTLALGGGLKSVFALGSGTRAMLSPHFGDLDDLGCVEAFRAAIDRFERLTGARPARFAHDLHPDFESTQYAIGRARELGAATCAVQHHHAHMAACMAEHGLSGELIGVCFDGFGLGDDKGAWGGELLVGGYRRVVRAAHLEPCPLAGGDAAVRQPWRIALAQLMRAGLAAERWVAAPSAHELAQVAALIERGAACTESSSVGRLFDAVASLVLGLRESSYEAEAACRLEGLAERSDDDRAYELELEIGAPHVIRTSALFRQIVDDLDRRVPPHDVARRFHAGLVEAVARVCVVLREESGLSRVVLSGGVFCNGWLSSALPRRLRVAGFEVFQHQRVPPNDGGLALGQLAVVAAGGGHPTERRSATCVSGFPAA